ncbi:hypothetical protein Tco_1091451 [Tanacetum coccineum]|uniref:Retrotransposon protein, putative, Ty1-copia subclass n=1 Tax=Tanacetum coccineum TaxID=301880 RepID=A0ABQ5I972_9ASTR
MQEDRLTLNKNRCASTPGEVKRMQNVLLCFGSGSFMYAKCTDVCNIRAKSNMVFEQIPMKPHWTAVKTILKYLRNTKHMFLVYEGNPEAGLRVECYCDAGFETDRDDTKSET